MRGLYTLFALAFSVFWILGLTDPIASKWVAWFDFAAAIAVAGYVATGVKSVRRSDKAIFPGAMFGILFIAWVGALLTNASAWQVWWNFALAIAFSLCAGAELYDVDVRDYRPRNAEFRIHDHFEPSYPFGAAFPYLFGGYPMMGGAGVDFRGKGPRNYQRTDEKIAEDINEKLTEHWELDASDITVTVQEGMVALDGTVDSRRSKRLTEHICDTVIGVKDVVNNLRVRGSSSFGISRGDDLGKPTRAA